MREIYTWDCHVLMRNGSTDIKLSKAKKMERLFRFWIIRFKGEKKLKMEGRYSCEHTEDGMVKLNIKDAKENDKGTYR